MTARTIDAILHGAAKGLFGPCPDASLGVRGDVGGVDGPERCLQRKIPGKGRVIRARVTGRAVAIVGKHPAAFYQCLVKGGWVRRAESRAFRLVGTNGKSRSPAAHERCDRPCP